MYHPLLHPGASSWSPWDDDFGFDPFFDPFFNYSQRHRRHPRHHHHQITQGGEGGSDNGSTGAAAAAGGGGNAAAAAEGGSTSGGEIAQRGGGQQQQQQVAWPRRRPRFEIHDDKDAITLRAETPGIPKENLKVQVHDGRLTISGEEKHEQRGQGFYQSNFGSFEHSWTLPSHVDGENLSANYYDGVLHVRVPKRPLPEPRHVDIS